MNNPLVVEAAKKLAALPDFTKCADDNARIEFLYQRIYQRPPSPEEVQLGLDFISEQPEPEKVSSNDSVQLVSNDADPRPRFREKQGGKKRGGQGPANNFRKRAPLKAWEEYAHALLQANEASFIN
jgi:hypothetical protein